MVPRKRSTSYLTLLHKNMFMTQIDGRSLINLKKYYSSMYLATLPLVPAK